MKVLVTYASRHGATAGIAERIATTLEGAGFAVDQLPVTAVKALDGYDAFVVGSATYMFHWLAEATSFVHRNRSALAAKPVWLFSSGPLGTDALDSKGRDQKVVTIPREIDSLVADVHPRDHRVFFGAYHPEQKPKGLAERFMSLMPAAKAALPTGDFRDWPDIEAWAASIAEALGAARD